LTEKYCWLVADGWFVLREKYCCLVADKPSEQGVRETSTWRVELNLSVPIVKMDILALMKCVLT
jgi:hypothetical protein